MKSFLSRSPIAAFLLSFLIPGLGQLYNGQLKKGVTIYLLWFFLLPLLGSLVLIFHLKAFIFFLIAIFSCALLISIDAYRYAKKMGLNFTPKRYNRWYVYLVAYAVNVIFLVPLLLSLLPFKTWSVNSNSMCPTLLLRDRFIASKFYYMLHEPRRGDIVMFLSPSNPRVTWSKRIIGLPGDNVEIQGKQVFINGKLIDEPYLISNEQCSSVPQESSSQKYGPTPVPDDRLFVLGDNRDNSVDSRMFGFVDIKALKGKALFLYWARNKSRIGTRVK